jgi:hypothetical protein
VNIGIIGAGQLGRMLALAGYPLGLRFVFLDHSADAPGGQVGQIICGEFSDPQRLGRARRARRRAHLRRGERARGSRARRRAARPSCRRRPRLEADRIA